MKRWLVTVLGLSLIAGCQASVEPRRPMHGDVTVDAIKVRRGSISFLPTGATVGPAATTAIVDGRYEFSRTNGPYVGTYRVQVGVIALESNETEPTLALAAAEQSATAKAGVRPAPRGRARSGRVEPDNPRQWNAECVIEAQGNDRLNFDFVGESP